MNDPHSRLRALYEGQSERAHRFRYGLLVFDLVTILLIVVSSFLPRSAWIEAVDLVFGAIVLLDILVCLVICPRPAREFLRPTTWADIAAIVSFLAPIVGGGVGFLRAYHLLVRLRADSTFFRQTRR